MPDEIKYDYKEKTDKEILTDFLKMFNTVEQKGFKLTIKNDEISAIKERKRYIVYKFK